jgi:hypothetical protein
MTTNIRRNPTCLAKHLQFLLEFVECVDNDGDEKIQRQEAANDDKDQTENDGLVLVIRRWL